MRKKSTAKKVISNEWKKHNKMLEKNLETAKQKWKTLVTELNDLGYKITPQIVPAGMEGLYTAVINMKGMTPQEYDKHKNPEKYEKIKKQKLKELKK